MASDMAITASLALQFGCPAEVLRRAIKRDGQGRAASLLGAALDWPQEETNKAGAA
jgi:hypothetical protein